MDHSGIAASFEKAAEIVSEGRSSVFEGQSRNWWPTQAETIALGWSIAFDWVKAEVKGHLSYWTTWGQTKHRQMMDRVCEGHGRSIEEGHYMLDFAVMPSKPKLGCERTPVLTMESEAYAGHKVTLKDADEGGYAWDFLKLLWVPSPRRLFLARVGGKVGAPVGERIKALRGTIDTFVAHNPNNLADSDKLCILILGAGVRSWRESMVGVRRGSSLEWRCLSELLEKP